MRLEGKVTLVTGGGRGIGRGIALILAKEGANVAVADIDYSNVQEVAAEIKERGRRAIAVEADVTTWDQIQVMVKQTINELGKIDIAVHNAGVISISPVEEMEEAVGDFAESNEKRRLYEAIINKEAKK